MLLMLIVTYINRAQRATGHCCFGRRSRAAGYCHGNGGYISMAARLLLPAEGRALRAMGHRNGYGNEAPLLPGQPTL